METKIEQTENGKTKITFVLNKEDMRKRREKLAKLHAERDKAKKNKQETELLQ